MPLRGANKSNWEGRNKSSYVQVYSQSKLWLYNLAAVGTRAKPWFVLVSHLNLGCPFSSPRQTATNGKSRTKLGCNSWFVWRDANHELGFGHNEPNHGLRLSWVEASGLGEQWSSCCTHPHSCLAIFWLSVMCELGEYRGNLQLPTAGQQMKAHSPCLTWRGALELVHFGEWNNGHQPQSALVKVISLMYIKSKDFSVHSNIFQKSWYCLVFWLNLWVWNMIIYNQGKL